MILGLMFGAYLISLVVSLTRMLNHALNDQFEKLKKRVKNEKTRMSYMWELCNFIKRPENVLGLLY